MHHEDCPHLSTLNVPARALPCLMDALYCILGDPADAPCAAVLALRSWCQLRSSLCAASWSATPASLIQAQCCRRSLLGSKTASRSKPWQVGRALLGAVLTQQKPEPASCRRAAVLVQGTCTICTAQTTCADYAPDTCKSELDTTMILLLMGCEDGNLLHHLTAERLNCVTAEPLKQSIA